MIKSATLPLFLFLLSPLFIRSQAPGTLDPGFNQTGILPVLINGQKTGYYDVNALPDGKFYAAGVTLDPSGFPFGLLSRYYPDGTVDTSFGVGGHFIANDPNLHGFGSISGFDVKSDGSIMVVMDNSYGSYVEVIKLTPEGVEDPSFGTGGVTVAQIPAPIYALYTSEVDFQPDGKMVLFGRYRDYDNDRDLGVVVRLTAEGNLDVTFKGTGFIPLAPSNTQLKFFMEGGDVQPDGKIIAPGGVGSSSADAKWYIYRFNADGSADATFDGDGLLIKDLGPETWESARDAIVLPDGKILVAGYAQKAPGFQFTILKLLPNGSLDTDFALGGKAQVGFNALYSDIFNIELQPNGKILACGYAADNLDFLRFAVARFKANGLIDNSFGTNGKVMLNFGNDAASQRCIEACVLNTGKIVACGYDDEFDYLTTGRLVMLYGDALSGVSAPATLELNINAFPNPMTGGVLHLAYQLPESANVTVAIYDMKGRLVMAPVIESSRSAGENREEMPIPEGLPAGQYLLRIDTPAGGQSVKLVKTTP